MKRFTLIVLTFLLVLGSCIPVCAVNLGDAVYTKEVAFKVPSDYTYVGLLLSDTESSLSYDKDDFQCSITVFCLENEEYPQGIKEIGSDDAVKILKNMYFDDETANMYNFIVESGKVTDVNGVNAYELDCIQQDKTDSSLSFGGLYYIFATKENIIIVGFDDSTEEFSHYDDAIAFMSSFGVYGTYFDDDSSTIENVVGDIPSFNEYVKQRKNDFYDVYIDDEYNTIENGFYGEYFAGAAIIGVVLFCLGGFLMLALIVAVIVLAIKNSQNKKLIKEYEARLSVLQNSNNGYNPVNTPIHIDEQIKESVLNGESE